MVSPIDGRYYNEIRELEDFFSEWALIKYRVKIEVEWLITMSKSKWFAEVRSFSPEEILLLRNLVNRFNDSEALKIKEIEKITKHDVKAVEYYLKDIIKNSSLKDITEFVHFGCTSEDINNLSYALILMNGITSVWLPRAQQLVDLVAQNAEKYKDIAMLSHTHGQPATPTTVGKELAIFVYRWRRQLNYLNKIEYFGKFNGAVGNFNAQYIAYPEVPWEDIAKSFVEGLSLAYYPLTTQIEPHDYMAECFHTINRFNNVTLDFNIDMWLYISLGYFKQSATSEEIGSSTMPHKVNPINFETSEANIGLSNTILSHLADKLQISRLQRDLSDSSSKRNIGTGIAHSLISLNYTYRGVKQLSISQETIDNELSDSWEVLGEAIQTVMRKNGYSNPYEILKKLMRGNKVTCGDIIKFVNKLDIPENEKKHLLELTPATYTGIASKLVNWIHQ